ncbi:uncharacterized protein EI97DRAFT_109311 [Westerdykella ornata]|uniref:Uncharacterized protein n=1 Tax=Westerdykella ornata TaxID=318751 RepID=A0A6A6JV17_WESOR|nr:uncharacterized protein EI97DRAFT_109311 [Westerdykella ornata]KAF2280064.1 hypothetical protein EI97DRAFT_109311 [Westerdykella ornata]
MHIIPCPSSWQDFPTSLIRTDRLHTLQHTSPSPVVMILLGFSYHFPTSFGVRNIAVVCSSCTTDTTPKAAYCRRLGNIGPGCLLISAYERVSLAWSTDALGCCQLVPQPGRNYPSEHGIVLCHPRCLRFPTTARGSPPARTRSKCLAPCMVHRFLDS